LAGEEGRVTPSELYGGPCDGLRLYINPGWPTVDIAVKQGFSPFETVEPTATVPYTVAVYRLMPSGRYEYTGTRAPA
jgi:hypothetical protein